MTIQELMHVLLLRDYNTRIVALGVTALGAAGGVIGAHLGLRKRALLADAISHATLPGIALAFLAFTALGHDGKALPGLLTGAAITGALAVIALLAIVHTSRIKEDAGLGIVLSVFFGAGVTLSSLVQSTQTGSAAGLDAFIYGKTAAMIAGDAKLILIGGGIAVVIAILLHKELALLSFDSGYARAQGWPVVLLDWILMSLVVGITVIGLQAVGLILMIAVLVIPPAAARFWTDELPRMIIISAALGAISGFIGALVSALLPRVPSGAAIVLVAGIFFLLSLAFGPARGVIHRVIEQRRLESRIRLQHLLRTMYEQTEAQDAMAAGGAMSLAQIAAARAWPVGEPRRGLAQAIAAGLVRPLAAGMNADFALTEAGRLHARRVTRNHRLWELYLIEYADIAPSHVDRDADEVEHVLDADLIEKLEKLLAADYPDLVTLPSPHRIPTLGGARVPA